MKNKKISMNNAVFFVLLKEQTVFLLNSVLLTNHINCYKIFKTK